MNAAKKALLRQRQLEAQAQMQGQPTAKTGSIGPSIGTVKSAELPTETIRPMEGASLEVIQSSMPVHRARSVEMPSATVRPAEFEQATVVDMPAIDVIGAETAANPSIETTKIPSNDVSPTLDMIRASKLYSNPQIKQQVDMMEEKYSPVGDYLKKKGAK